MTGLYVNAEEAELSSPKFPGFASARIWRPSLLMLIFGVAILCSPIAFSQTAPAATAASTSAKPKAAKAHAASSSDPAVSAVPSKSFGNKTAPITMEVFSDYQCPSCRAFFEQTLRPLLGPDGYVAAGKVYLVHRDFPLPMHPYSYQAARWANAAAKIGRFQDVDAALFDNQNSWAADGDIEKFVAAAMSPADFKRVQRLMAGCEAPATAGVKPASVKLNSGGQAGQGCALDAYISSDQELGKSVPVQATPTFVIFYKGQKYPASSGMVTYPILKQFFDSLLSQ
jgi:protein-disulfide isomerase